MRGRERRKKKKRGLSPCDHHIFPIRLGLQALDGLQLDLSLGLAVELHLVGQQTDLPGQAVNRLGSAGAGDHNVAAGGRGHTIIY